MADTMTRDPDEHAISNARGWWSSIQEMVAAYEAAMEGERGADIEAAQRSFDESALSVEVRSGWHSPGGESEAEEYRILLTTGGPALQLTGKLGAWNEPETAELQIQDWFKPWREWRPDDAPNFEETLLTFARRFYFGE